MSFILSFLIDAVVLLVVAYIMPQVSIRSFGTALVAAILIALFNSTVGFLIRLPLNLVTLFLLQFLVRLFVTALIIKLVDKLMKGFEVKGFWPALVIAIVMGIAGHLNDRMFHDEEIDSRSTRAELHTAATQPLAMSLK